jgi:GntR family transcriptional regulator of vanillate catabolism
MEQDQNKRSRPQRRALAEWALEHFYDLIFTGALPAGTDLGEEEFSDRFGVSRATISSALRQLEIDGLATVAAANGRRVVATFTIADIGDLYTVRAVLESHAAEQAAPLMRSADIDQLNALQREMETLSRSVSDPKRRDFGVDFDFHRAIVRAAGSRRVENCLIPIWNQTHALLRHLYSLGAYPDAAENDASYRDHRAIIDALAAGDGVAAGLAMRAHLYGRRDRLVSGVRGMRGVINPRHNKPEETE